jgi:ElaB/YqjD/DUF883 family membrane-anchored ribosome-binding protein
MMSDARLFPEGQGKSAEEVDEFLEDLATKQHATDRPEPDPVDEAIVDEWEQEAGLREEARLSSSADAMPEADRQGSSGADGADNSGQSSLGDAAFKGKEALSTAKDKATDVSDQAKEKVADVSSQAHAKADEGMNKAAEGVTQAADMLRQRGEQTGGSVGSAATTVADKLDTAGSYLQEKDTDQLLQDLEALIRRKPVESLLVAAGAGFVLSKLFS